MSRIFLKTAKPNRGGIRIAPLLTTKRLRGRRIIYCKKREKQTRWWTNKVFSSKLAGAHKRPMDPGNRIGLSTGAPEITIPGIETPKTGLGCKEEQGSRHRVREVENKESNSSCSQPNWKFSQPDVPSAQGGWLLETSYQSTFTKSVYCSPPFQDGGNTSSKGSNEKERLDGEIGSKRCVPFSTNVRAISEISPIRVVPTNMGIQLPTLRPKQCPVHFHKATETSSGSIEKVGDTMHFVSRRHAHHGPIQTDTPATAGNSNRPVGVSGIHYQPRQECGRAITHNRVLGISSQFHINDHCSSKQKGSSDSTVDEEDAKNNTDCNQVTCTITGFNGSCPPSHTPSTVVLSATGETKDPTSPITRLRLKNEPHVTHEERPDLVDNPPETTQWSQPPDLSLGLGNRIGCLNERVGSELWRNIHRRPLDQRRESQSHKFLGASSSLPCPEDICAKSQTEQGTFTSGQCHSNLIHQQDGGNPLISTFRSCSGNVEMVPTEGCHNPCGTSPRHREHQSRLGISACERFERLETPKGSFLTAGTKVWTLHNRPVCIQNKCTDTDLLQLETGSTSSGGGCIVDIMAKPQTLHVSPVFSDYQMLGENRPRRSGCYTNSSSLAEPGLVSKSTGITNGRSNSTSGDSQHCDGHRQQHTPTSIPGSSTTSRLAHIRQTFSTRGLSEGVITILNKSWRSSTESAYSSAWRQWSDWCGQWGLHPISAPLKDILEFLLSQFQAGKQYRTLNTIRSAISMTHEEVDGVRVGQHELVSRFMKGIFNSNPPTPRYSATWDVDIVLKYLSSLPENIVLPLTALTHKLAMLFALCSANRCSELAALDLNFCSVLADGIKFVIPGLTKTRRKGPPKEVIFSSFSENRNLCPVSTFLEYRLRTSKLRPKQEEGCLFIAVKKPHRPVTSATIGHWLKKILKQSGIDTSIFSAHSTRGAATSKASTAGISIPDILKTADWSSASTFRRFYHRPISSSAFGQAVLSGRQSSSSKVSYKRYHVVN